MEDNTRKTDIILAKSKLIANFATLILEGMQKVGIETQRIFDRRDIPLYNKEKDYDGNAD